jgi:hypothetical protein
MWSIPARASAIPNSAITPTPATGTSRSKSSRNAHTNCSQPIQGALPTVSSGASSASACHESSSDAPSPTRITSTARSLRSESHRLMRSYQGTFARRRSTRASTPIVTMLSTTSAKNVGVSTSRTPSGRSAKLNRLNHFTWAYAVAGSASAAAAASEKRMTSG